MGQVQVLGPGLCHAPHTYHQGQSSEVGSLGVKGASAPGLLLVLLPPHLPRGLSQDVRGTGLRLAALCRMVPAVVLQCPHAAAAAAALTALYVLKFFTCSSRGCTQNSA